MLSLKFLFLKIFEIKLLNSIHEIMEIINNEINNIYEKKNIKINNDKRKNDVMILLIKFELMKFHQNFSLKV